MSKNILVVDDEEHMLRLIQFALLPLGAQVVTLRRGEDALAHLRQSGADLLLLDYSMPGLNGVETLRRIRAEPGGANLPAIMLTARDQTAIRQDAAGLNVQAFLTKPFSPSDLARRVREILTIPAAEPQRPLPGGPGSSIGTS